MLEKTLSQPAKTVERTVYRILGRRGNEWQFASHRYYDNMEQVELWKEEHKRNCFYRADKSYDELKIVSRKEVSTYSEWEVV